MYILKLLLSAMKRIVTAVSMPFRLLIVQVQKLFNINIITAKLIQPLTSNVRKVLNLKPTSDKEYYKVGKFLIYKKLLTALIFAICAGVFIYFNNIAPVQEAAPVTTVTEIKTNIYFKYDDIAIKDFSGMANITDYLGNVIYTGEIDAGVCKGFGYVYNADGELLYEGSLDKNKYNGNGTSYYSDGTVCYTGEFTENLYSGAGKLYRADGSLLYDGMFKDGQYSGEGKIYFENNALQYEGQFSANNSHGIGKLYYPTGAPKYSGEFVSGQMQGVGTLYDQSGKELYTGPMYNDEINYKSLLNASLSAVEDAFTETPVIYYLDNGSACFQFPLAGVVVTADCRVRVHEWDTAWGDNDTSSAENYYYMPGAGNVDTWQMPSLAFVRPLASIRPVSWQVVDGSGNSTSNSGSTGAGRNSQSSKQSNWQYGGSTSQSSSAQEYNAPDSGQDNMYAQEFYQSQPESDLSKPNFIQREKAIYFEIDTDIWQIESELEKEKVLIKKVTVMGAGKVPEGKDVIKLDEDLPPSIEDCVAIETLRQDKPSAFEDVIYQVNRQNKLVRNVWSISHASGVTRDSYLTENIIYRFCYDEQSGESAYYSIEN